MTARRSDPDAERDSDTTRRSVVPEAAGRSIWLSAIWTGVGAAVVAAILAVVAVAVCWLPVSGAHASTGSAIRAGLLTFLAALHGGVTIDGTSTQFIPLGMTAIVGLAAWRAGSGLGDAATALGERDPLRLLIGAALQAASFTIAALVAVPVAHLGTSSAPVVGVGGMALLLFAATGGVAFVRACALREWVGDRVPAYVARAARAAAVAGLAYLGAGALLAAGSLALHAGRVEAISRQVGGGWGSVPILLLGLLAAPNAAIAGTGYLTGAGFTVGSGTSVGLTTTSHGVLPAFPLLGAIPTGHGAPWYVWVLVAATPLSAGIAVAVLALGAGGWWERLRHVAVAVVFAALGWAVLVWQGGGGIGTGRLAAIGASWWQVGGLVIAGVLGTSLVSLALHAAWAAVRNRDRADVVDVSASITALSRAITTVLPRRSDEDASGDDGAADETDADVAGKAGKPGKAGKLAG